MYESSNVVAKLEVDLGNGILESHPDNYQDKRLDLERKEEIYNKTLEKRRLKQWKNLTEGNSIFSKKIKEVELNKSRNVINNDTSIQRNNHEDSLDVEKSTNKSGFIKDNRVSRITAVRIAPYLLETSKFHYFVKTFLKQPVLQAKFVINLY